MKKKFDILCVLSVYVKVMVQEAILEAGVVVGQKASYDELQQGVLKNMYWFSQSSGIGIPNDIADILEKNGQILTRTEI